MDAIEVDGDMVEIVGPRQAKVQSKSQPTIWYAVDLDAHTCTCKGHEIRTRCRHYDAVEGFASGRTAAAGTSDIVHVTIFTSRYQDGEAIVASGAVPVGVTAGYPRFKLKGYKPVEGWPTEHIPSRLPAAEAKWAELRALAGVG